MSLYNATGGATPISLTSRDDLERDVAAVRAALGEAEFEAARRRGEELANSPALWSTGLA